MLRFEQVASNKNLVTLKVKLMVKQGSNEKAKQESKEKVKQESKQKVKLTQLPLERSFH